MKKKFKLILTIFASITLFYSCSQDDNILTSASLDQAQSSLKLAIDSLTLEGDSIVPIVVNPDSIKSKLIQTRTTRAYDDYDENFWSNMWAIRELPITLQARGQANTANRYLSTNGKSKEITLSNTSYSNNQKFYIRVLPASSGIPYLIYSNQERTPISVGQYSNNPNNKILYTLPNESGSLYSAGWDFVSSGYGYAGYYAIQSQSYIGQSDPNNMWSIFYHVIEIKNDNKVGYGQYTKKSQQEFLLKPDAIFTLQTITYDANSAVITESSPIKIVSTARNTSVEAKSYTIPVNNLASETSYFSEKNTLNFNLNPKAFQRPTVEANRIVLPKSTTPSDALYRTTSTQNIAKTLLFNVEGDAPERSLIEVTSYVKTYNVSINYTVKGTYSDREIKLSGTWKGTIIIDPKISPPNHIPRYFNLESGEEIYYSRSAIKTTFNK